VDQHLVKMDSIERAIRERHRADIANVIARTGPQGAPFR
jgi:hypothetical protein